MNAREAAGRLENAEAEFASASRRLTSLRDSQLHGYEIEDLYRIALREYYYARHELLKARYVAAVTHPALLAA